MGTNTDWGHHLGLERPPFRLGGGTSSEDFMYYRGTRLHRGGANVHIAGGGGRSGVLGEEFRCGFGGGGAHRGSARWVNGDLSLVPGPAQGPLPPDLTHI